MLVVFAGLPGVGETTLSRAVAQQTGATWLRADCDQAHGAGATRENQVGSEKPRATR